MRVYECRTNRYYETMYLIRHVNTKLFTKQHEPRGDKIIHIICLYTHVYL